MVIIRFGMHAGPSSGAPKFDSIRKRVLECERLGFDSVWFGDHLMSGTRPIFESWTTLSALALETKTLRLGNLVLCNKFRYPSHLAKMAATLDVISNGRLEFGIGAGWKKEEFFAYGIPFPKPAVRISQLREAVQLIKKIWTEEKPSFEGKYYTIREAICNPKPVQKPHPPIWIGGSGEQLLLNVVAELGDGSNFSGTLEDFKCKFKALEKHCLSFGRDPKEIQRSFLPHIIIAKSKREVKEKIRKYTQRLAITSQRSFTQESVLTRGIVGTPEQCIERIRKFVDLGVTYFMPTFPDVTDGLESLQLFGEKVIPEFR